MTTIETKEDLRITNQDIKDLHEHPALSTIRAVFEEKIGYKTDKVLSELSENERLVVAEYYYNQQSKTEIAKKTGFETTKVSLLLESGTEKISNLTEKDSKKLSQLFVLKKCFNTIHWTLCCDGLIDY